MRTVFWNLGLIFCGLYDTWNSGTSVRSSSSGFSKPACRNRLQHGLATGYEGYSTTLYLHECNIVRLQQARPVVNPRPRVNHWARVG